MKEVIDWLLEDAEPAVRFRTLTWLLDKPEDDREVRKARDRVTDDPTVRRIFSIQDEDGGFFGKGRLEPMQVLTDCGVPGSDSRVCKAVELIFSRFTEDGGFKHYYGKKLPCAAAYYLRILLAFGRENDGRTRKALDHLLSIQRLDGGWLHGLNTRPGGAKEHDESCPHATLHILHAMSCDEGLKSSKAAERAVESVLKHWETRIPAPEHAFGIGSRFVRLKYPLVGYHILAYASILAHYPKACKDKRLKEVARKIAEQRGEDGRFCASSVMKLFRDFEFGKKSQPSKWITLHALRVIKLVLGEKEI
ncbi:terpene cyclase/mutase family protein [candidate division WOR-3 bacterium]|nr:terpene cyclase/mutase family protein [candidate division WOR-3 bacterium]